MKLLSSKIRNFNEKFTYSKVFLLLSFTPQSILAFSKISKSVDPWKVLVTMIKVELRKQEMANADNNGYFPAGWLGENHGPVCWKGNTILQFELLDLIPTLTVSFKTLLLISL